ncbi:MAG TPA: hypothetical protein VG407_17595 [Caulobacteraceae bacterium]|jgi:hypothetical protein|nr:hypothetical protein [Caulobacteraceae bacterium]
MFGKALAVGALAALIAGAAAAAPAAPSDWANAQLKEMDAAGFGAPVDGLTFEGAALQGKTGEVKVSIPADGKYALVASCGEDCADIGLILQQNGQTVAEGDPGFHAQLKPGDYVLMIGFDNCKTAQCRWVVRAYQPKP